MLGNSSIPKQLTPQRPSPHCMTSYGRYLRRYVLAQSKGVVSHRRHSETHHRDNVLYVKDTPSKEAKQTNPPSSFSEMIASRDGLAQQEVPQEVDAEILAFRARRLSNLHLRMRTPSTELSVTQPRVTAYLSHMQEATSLIAHKHGKIFAT